MKETIVLYPHVAMGHIVSMVELAKLILGHHNHHLSVIILIATGPSNSSATTSYIHRISQSHSSISFHHFPSVSVDASPNRKHVATIFEFIRLNDPNLLQSLLTISKTSTIRALVIDLFCTTALHIAGGLNIPTYYFFTGGAAALATFLYLPTIHTQITESFKDLPTTFLDLPGLPLLKASHMPKPVLDRNDQAYHDFLYFSFHLPKSKGIIVNSFHSLEPKAIKAIVDGACVPDAPTPPVYYIGPLIIPASENEDGGGIDCLSWLDSQPSRSVVFMCFGSRGTFSTAQVKEIAVGLERSGQRFLWVIRSNPSSMGNNRKLSTEASGDSSLENWSLPEGFLDRTRDRGLVVNHWAPQVAVLSRESVGGFVTHCGWNSVLEAVVAGVPMVAWPLYAEQHLNKTVLVEDMKLALPVEQSEDGFVSEVEVEKRVRELMESEEGRALRERTREMRESALAAWSEFGSSMTAFSELSESWKRDR